MRYFQLEPDEIAIGQRALLLRLCEGALCAAALERRPDGRLRRSEPVAPGLGGLIETVRDLVRNNCGHLLVVLEGDAYWPDCFPVLEPLPKLVLR